MQQDLGGAAAEELEGVQLRSQSDANTRRGGSRIGRWGSGICGVGWSWGGFTGTDRRRNAKGGVHGVEPAGGSRARG
jgi:hypothetical protein